MQVEIKKRNSERMGGLVGWLGFDKNMKAREEEFFFCTETTFRIKVIGHDMTSSTL